MLPAHHNADHNESYTLFAAQPSSWHMSHTYTLFETHESYTFFAAQPSSWLIESYTLFAAQPSSWLIESHTLCCSTIMTHESYTVFDAQSSWFMRTDSYTLFAAQPSSWLMSHTHSLVPYHPSIMGDKHSPHPHVVTLLRNYQVHHAHPHVLTPVRNHPGASCSSTCHHPIPRNLELLFFQKNWD